MSEQNRTYPPIPNDLFFEQVIACLEEGKNVKMNVQGNSMFPFICHGDKIILSPIDNPSKLAIGDVVLAKSDHGTLLHRIVEIEQDLIILAGDRNPKQKEKAVRNQVFGITKDICRGDSSFDISSPRYMSFWKVWSLLRPIRRVLVVFLMPFTKFTNLHYENKR